MPRPRSNKTPASSPTTEWAVYSYKVADIRVGAYYKHPPSATYELSDGMRNQLKFVPGITVKSKDEVRRYSLSDCAMQDDLLARYCNVKDLFSAFEFVQEFGLLGGVIDVPTIDNLIDAAVYLNELLDLVDVIDKADLPGLRNRCAISQAGPNQIAVEIKMYNSNQAFTTVYASPTRDFQSETKIHFSTEAWRSFGSRGPEYAIRNYLAVAVRNLMSGVQPIVTWQKTIDGDWTLAETVLIETPWQGLCYALLRAVSGTGKIDKCKRCSTRFPANRNKEFCKPACNRSYLRTHGATVNSSPRRNRELKNENIKPV